MKPMRNACLSIVFQVNTNGFLPRQLEMRFKLNIFMGGLKNWRKLPNRSDDTTLELNQNLKTEMCWDSASDTGESFKQIIKPPSEEDAGNKSRKKKTKQK